MKFINLALTNQITVFRVGREGNGERGKGGGRGKEGGREGRVAHFGLRIQIFLNRFAEALQACYKRWTE